MTLRTGTLLLAVLGLGLGTIAARAADEPQSGTLEKTYNLPSDEADIIPVGAKVGSLVIEKIDLDNVPKAGEVKVAQANDSDDNSRPKIGVVVTNPTAFKLKAKVKASFVSADGTPFMSCDRKIDIKPLEDDDTFRLCLFESMKTRNWAKVKGVHLVVQVGRDKDD